MIIKEQREIRGALAIFHNTVLVMSEAGQNVGSSDIISHRVEKFLSIKLRA